MLYAFDDATDDCLEVALVFVITESQHFPSLTMLVPDNFHNAVVVLFPRFFPSVQSEASQRGVTAIESASSEVTSPKSRRPLPSCQSNASLRVRGSS